MDQVLVNIQKLPQMVPLCSYNALLHRTGCWEPIMGARSWQNSHCYFLLLTHSGSSRYGWLSITESKKTSSRGPAWCLSFSGHSSFTLLSGVGWRLHRVMHEEHNSIMDSCAFSATSHPILSGVIRLKVSPISSCKFKTRVTEYKFHVGEWKGQKSRINLDSG